VAAKFAPTDPLFVFSLDRLFSRERARKKGRRLRTPDFIFLGTFQECLKFIQARAEKLGSRILDDIVIETKKHGVVRWTIRDLHNLEK
jgi:hypothetical protein